MTPTELAAYALHLRFDAMVKASPDIQEFSVLGARFQHQVDRVIPPALREHRQAAGSLAGFSRVLVVKDRSGKLAYVAAAQDGHFWPFEPALTDGKGQKARNEWAAKEMERRFAGS